MSMKHRSRGVPESSVPSAEPSGQSSCPPSLFALIIGINKYHDPDVPNLRGAVPDADAVQDFLISKLGVAKDRIVNLRDRQATREAMVEAIQNLAVNTAIGIEDPILIYFAGHGSQARGPADWITNDANGLIQMLCPHDSDSKGSKNLQGQGLLDLTLSQLLADIAERKSNNITVIFDCCHSGHSGTRESKSDETFLARGIELPSDYTIPANVYSSQERSSAIPSSHEKSGLNSHVLLAACKRGQSAGESLSLGRGVFTVAFLSFLEVNLEAINQLTYTDIITRMPILPSQNPQCEGVNRNRVLFHSKGVAPYRRMYRISQPKSLEHEYTLEGGEAHGITKSAEFDIYSDERMTPSTFLGSVVARDTAPFITRCSPITSSPASPLPRPAYAVQRRIGEGQDLRLCIDPSDAFFNLSMTLGKEMQGTDPNRRSFLLLDKYSNKQDLSISSCGGLVEFHIMDDVCREHGLESMPFYDIRVDDIDRLLTILRSAADFYWNFRHSNMGSKLTPQITVECFRLVPTGKRSSKLIPILVPDGLNLVKTDSGKPKIVINVEERTTYGRRSNQPVKYGFKITNNSAVSLYAAVFYFDISDLSIRHYYQPGTAANGNVDFSLPAHGSLTIGYGDGGEAPRNYFLRDNQSVDVGFLKVYLSAEFIDYTSIAQDSPFAQNRASAIGKRRCRWDTLTLPIIQRKGTGVSSESRDLGGQS